MNLENLSQTCMSCFSALNPGGAFCPVCGYNETMRGETLYHLPHRTVLSGKYLIGRVLGEGGFGITYLGYDLNLGIKVAVKEYYPSGLVMRTTTVSMTVQPAGGEQGEYFAKGRERFVDEAKRLARFRMLAGIVMVSDFFVENGTAYIVMEYVEGTTLKNVLANVGGKLPAAQVFEMMLPVFSSLAQVHESGIIHRDISPDNIMVAADGSVKLLDFGAAREFGEEGNKSLSVMLKHGYAPVEQYSSRGVQGPYTDVYALSATLYKAITGVTPDDSMDRVFEDRLVPPSRLGIFLPKHQEDALMYGLAVRIENRWRTVAEMYAALQIRPAATGQPTPSAPVAPHTAQPPVPQTPNSKLHTQHSVSPEPSPPSTLHSVSPTTAAKGETTSKQKKTIIAVVIAACVLIAVGLAFSLSGVLSGDKPGSSDEYDIISEIMLNPDLMPDLSEMTYIEAADVLGRLEIPYYATAEYDNALAAGTLSSYALDEGEERVMLIVSAGGRPDETTDIKPPIALGYTFNYANGQAVSGNFNILTNGDSRVSYANLGRVNPDDYGNTIGVNNYRNEPGEPTLHRVSISDMARNQMTNNIRQNGLNHDGYDAQFRLENLNNDWERIGEPVVSPINLHININGDAAPEITGITLVSEPDDIDEYNNGKVNYLLHGNFQKGRRYHLRGFPDGSGIYGEHTCKSDGMLEVDTRVRMNERNERNGYLPQRIEAMECISFSIDEFSNQGTAEFSQLGAWIGMGITESQIPDMIGWKYPDAMNALGPLGGLEYCFKTEHNSTFTAGTIMAQDYDADFGMINLVFSAGPEPPNNADPKPIYLGIAIEPNRWSRENEAQLRWITPRTNGIFRSEAYAQPSSFHGDWYIPNVGYGESSETKPLVHSNNYSLVDDSIYFDTFFRESGQQNMSAFPAQDQETMNIYLTMWSIDGDWEGVYDTPDSRKTVIHSAFRLSIIKIDLLSEAALISSEPYDYPWDTDTEYFTHKYFITGAFDPDTVSSVRAIDRQGYRFYWLNRRYDDSIVGGMGVSTELSEYDIRDDKIPVFAIVFLNNTASLGADGMVTVSSSYDYIMIDNSGFASVQPPVEVPSEPSVSEEAKDAIWDYLEEITGGAITVVVGADENVTARYPIDLSGNINSLYTFRVTGNSTWTIWGSGIYTSDSSISTAATHAGLVGIGEEALVVIRILPGQNSYDGSTNNGVTSSSWGSYGSSYEFVTG